MTYKIILIALISFTLYHGGYLDEAASSGANKVFLPEGDHIIPLGDQYCTAVNNTPISTVPVCAGGSNGSGSLCSISSIGMCLPAHEVKLGHQCDPYLWRFARRAWDDALAAKKHWASNTALLGSKIRDTDADFRYKDGHCTYYCPAKICMETIQHEDPDMPIQWVDKRKYDCLHNKVIDRYSGVCTCGSEYSWVDPLIPNRTLDNDTFLVNYSRTTGLDRKLVYDSRRKNCSAERYGHCSYKWPPQYKEFETPCLSDWKCVNRSVAGVYLKPFRTLKGVWYGLCDSETPLYDPFGGAAGIRPRTQISVERFLVIFLSTLLICIF